jgi:hypothetical protein
MSVLSFFKGTKNSENPKSFRTNYYISENFHTFLKGSSSFCSSGVYKYISDFCNLKDTAIGEKSYPVSFINYKNGLISFVPVKNLHKDYFENKIEGDTYESFINRNIDKFFLEGEKNSVKAGRFIQKMFPNMTDSVSEQFANICKNYVAGEFEFVILKGEDIRSYYHKDKQYLKDGTRIFNSCMNWSTGKETHIVNKLPIIRLLDFYVHNPNCELLVLKHKEEDKIAARALFWTTQTGKKYIEMVYSNNDSLHMLYRKYAVDNNCLSYDNGSKGFKITCPDEIKKLEVLPTYLDSLIYNRVDNIITR